MMFRTDVALIFFLLRRSGFSCFSSEENLKNVKLDAGGADRSLHRACNNNSGRCELLLCHLLGVSSNIQQWCLITYIKYLIP